MALRTRIKSCMQVLRTAVILALFATPAIFLAPSVVRGKSLQLGDVEFVQFLLVWTGDYNGIIDGISGPQTRAALTGFFERRFGRSPDTATNDQIEALVTDAASAIERAGFTLHRDQQLGLTFGVPEALVQPAPSSDPRRRIFRSSDDSIELEVAYLPNKYASLDQLFRRLTAMPGRTVSYSAFRPTWFVISGTDRQHEFYVRYHGHGSEIRGFAISYTREHATELGPAIIAMSNMFRASATATDPLIAFFEDLQSYEGEPGAIAAAPPKEPPRGDSSGSGFIVDAEGHVLTNAHVVSQCLEIDVGPSGTARLVAIDQSNDLAVLEAPSTRTAPALVFRSDPIKLGEEVIAAGFPLHGILADSINITPGVVSSLSGLQNDSRYLQTTAAVQPGNSGGPLVDRSGKVVGIVSAKLDAAFALREGNFIPENVNFAIRHDTIKPFLDANRIAFAAGPRDPDAKSVEEVADLVRRSVVSITCRAGS